jgi:predicted GIY-YIG superfamily endonuclease
MVAIYVLKLERGKYYVGMTRRNVKRVLQHIDGKGAAWTKKYPPQKTKPVLSFNEGLRVSDEDRITLETMKKYGVRNVRGGSWCKVNMSSREINKLEKKISTLKKKQATRRRRRKCSRCGRTNHIKPNCYARTHADGRKLRQKEKVDSKVYEAFLRQKNAAKKAALEAEMSKKENQRKQNEINRLNREIKDLNAASEETNPEARLKILQTLSENDMEFLRKHLGKGLALVGVAGIAAAIAAPKAKQALSSAKKSGVEAGEKIRDIVSKKKSEWK